MRRSPVIFLFLICFWAISGSLCAQAQLIKARASAIDPKVQAYPKIQFLITHANGKAADTQHAQWDPSVKSRDSLVIWLNGYNSHLFKRLNSYGSHAIRVHYANSWFSKICREVPVDPNCRGNVRLEAATGKDVSPLVDIAFRDSVHGRALSFVKWLNVKQPEAHWERFLNEDRSDLLWDKITLAGASHGATTSARFAKAQKVARVVCLCGPRDQYQTWQSLPSATPAERFFCFSHILDGGWTGHHYCRSWDMLGLNKFGPITNVDKTAFPFGHSRQLVTSYDVNADPRIAHQAVQPGKHAKKNTDGSLAHEDVWRYLFTHDSRSTGSPVKREPSCVVAPQE